jgi:hypothetical protein
MRFSGGIGATGSFLWDMQANSEGTFCPQLFAHVASIKFRLAEHARNPKFSARHADHDPISAWVTTTGATG